MPYRAPAIDRKFAMRYIPEPMSGCWIWVGGRKPEPMNYGVIGVGRTADGTYRQEYAHRLSYLLHVGPIAEGKCVLHHCDNPPCVNPEHLFLGDHADNVRDKIEKGRGNEGERNGQAKLSADQVATIRASSDAPLKLAAHYRVSLSQIHRIRNGERWSA